MLDLHTPARAAAAREAGRDRSVHTVGFLHQVSSNGKAAVVSVHGSEPITLPCAPSTYTGVTTVHVLLEGGTGRPVYVLAPGEVIAPEAIVQPPPPPVKDSGGTIVDTPPADRQVLGRVIKPTWSGTYRHSAGAWDRWNLTANGGRSNLYQGQASSGSGPLTGMAVYGDQVKNLGAKSIERIRLTMVAQGQFGSPTWTVVVQGATNKTPPSGAPSLTGPTATRTDVPGWQKAGQSVTLDLPSVIREDFRTGYSGALALVGSAWGALFGTSHAAGMALTVDYTVVG